MREHRLFCSTQKLPLRRMHYKGKTTTTRRASKLAIFASGEKWDRGGKWAAIFLSALNFQVFIMFPADSCVSSTVVPMLGYNSAFAT